VGPSYHARIGSPVSQWYIFNDFTINPIPPEEAVWFNLKWKIPCIICFTADLLPSSLEKLFYKVRASASLFIIFRTLPAEEGRLSREEEERTLGEQKLRTV
jgi:hypothetical protein